MVPQNPRKVVVLFLFHCQFSKEVVQRVNVGDSFRKESLINQHDKSRKPTILIWYPPFGRKNQYEVSSRTCGRKLECHVTYDRALVDNSDAVVFHFKSLELKTMPVKRLADSLCNS